uniref:Uncharacterized protein n=1 Tax=Aegilops tauschii subsp. strangulata TaxID=200361 RepID=A0A452YHR4_AEGTS
TSALLPAPRPRVGARAASPRTAQLGGQPSPAGQAGRGRGHRSEQQRRPLSSTHTHHYFPLPPPDHPPTYQPPRRPISPHRHRYRRRRSSGSRSSRGTDELPLPFPSLPPAILPAKSLPLGDLARRSRSRSAPSCPQAFDPSLPRSPARAARQRIRRGEAQVDRYLRLAMKGPSGSSGGRDPWAPPPGSGGGGGGG